MPKRRLSPSIRQESSDTAQEPIRSRPVTMQEIGARCGFHKATVQRVLAGLPGISAKTREIILATAHEMGYTPALQEAARRLAWQKHGRQVMNHLIALVFPPDFHRKSFFSQLFHGMMDVLSAERFDLVTIYHRDYWGEGFPHTIARGEIDGLLIFGHQSNSQQLIDSLRMNPNFLQRPVVSLVLTAFNGCSYVGFDEYQCGYLATSHLLDLGHRAIAYSVSDPQNTKRNLGIYQACHERGFNPEQVLYRMEKFDTHLSYTERIVKPLHQLLDAHPEITALIAPNDSYAIRARDILNERGLRVPDDFSLVGNDDTDPMHDASLNNILTTIRVPLLELGSEAACHMLRRIRNEETMNKQIILPVELIERASTAPPSKVTVNL